jgi:hypothetical protein
VDSLQYVPLLDDVMQVRLHELEHKVKVLVIGSSMHVQQTDYVWMVSKFFEEDNFPADRQLDGWMDGAMDGRQFD